MKECKLSSLFSLKMYITWDTKWERKSFFPLYFGRLLKLLPSHCCARFLLFQRWRNFFLFLFCPLLSSLFFFSDVFRVCFFFGWGYLPFFFPFSFGHMDILSIPIFPCLSTTMQPPSLFVF